MGNFITKINYEKGKVQRIQEYLDELIETKDSETHTYKTTEGYYVIQSIWYGEALTVKLNKSDLIPLCNRVDIDKVDEVIDNFIIQELYKEYIRIENFKSKN